MTLIHRDSALTENYTYDEVGNRLTSTDVASYSYNSSNQLTAADASSFTYDHNGNTTTKTDTNGQTTYAWDYENRLTSVALPNGGGVVSFKYDPFGRRIQKSSGSGTTIYVYDGANGVEEVNASGAVVARYVQGAGIDEPLAQSRSGLSYYNADGLGSITSLTDSSGAPTATFVYGAFGVLNSSTGTTANSYRYTAREYDQETGLYYYRARYYETGRFLSEDPIGFSGGSNAYSYVENNPATYGDPIGLQSPGQQMSIALQGLNPSPFNQTPRPADYYSLSINGPWVGVNVQRDRFRNWYTTFPVFNPPGLGWKVGASFTKGFLNKPKARTCDEERLEIHDFLVSWGAQACSGVVFGVCWTYSPGSGSATEVGIMTPQVGVSGGWTNGVDPRPKPHDFQFNSFADMPNGRGSIQ